MAIQKIDFHQFMQISWVLNIYILYGKKQNHLKFYNVFMLHTPGIFHKKKREKRVANVEKYKHTKYVVFFFFFTPYFRFPLNPRNRTHIKKKLAEQSRHATTWKSHPCHAILPTEWNITKGTFYEFCKTSPCQY